MSFTQQINALPPEAFHATAIKLGGIVGGGSFFSGMFLEVSALQAAGTFLGGLSAFITVLFHIYKYHEARK